MIFFLRLIANIWQLAKKCLTELYWSAGTLNPSFYSESRIDRTKEVLLREFSL